MKCVICKFSQIEEGKVTVTLQRGETVVIIKDVPANICKNCGEYYLDEIVTNRVFAQAEAEHVNENETLFSNI
jgi:YgiT-type zinc finger domain-containing protein